MLRIILAAIVLLLSATAVEAAAICTVHVSDLDFGSVDTVGNNAATSSADVVISCSDVTLGTPSISLCGSIGAGSGGDVGGTRQSSAGAGTLGFGLYAASGGTVPWGSADAPDLGDAQAISVPVSGDTANATVQLYGIVPRGQQSAAVGDYSSDFSTSDVDFKYAESALDCATPGAAADTSASFTVRASVPANCLLQTSDLDFGTAGLIGHNIDASTNLGVTCTPGTSYSISIDGGGSGDPSHRVMSAGAATVSYGLYTDAGRMTVWGAASVSGSGDGSKKSETVYGRIPPQAAPPGSYKDTVVVTISY